MEIVPNKLIRDIVVRRFNKSDRAKVGIKFYSHDLHSMYLSGQTTIIEEMINRHQNNPYQTPEEMVGDLQILLVQIWNEFHKLYPTTSAPLTLDKVLVADTTGLIKKES